MAWGHILWLGEVQRSSPCFVNLSCPGRPCFGSSDVFYFVGLPFCPSASWPLSFLSLFFLFLRPCLIHARMPDWGRAFVHGHTFLHSWTHFLAFMDTLSCIHGHTFLHSWSGPMTLVVGLLHGATFLSNLPLVLFMSFIGP